MDQKIPPQETPASMEILVLGLCRTETLSMKIALEDLGYKKVYHFSTIDKHQSHPDLWIAALKQKYQPPTGTRPEAVKTDWDQLLGEYDAVTDIPAACFAPELIAAYPNAKIILTTRSAASWHNSMLRTIHALQSSYINRFLLLFSDERTRNLSNLADLIIKYYFHGSIPAHGMRVFEEHNEVARQISLRGKRQFLEFKLGDGWEPLCEFLRKPVPSEEFPRVNDTLSWRKTFRLDLGCRIFFSVGILTVTLLVTSLMTRIKYLGGVT